MSAAARYLPHPVLSAVLLAVWLWLNESLAPGQLILGGAFAWLIPLFTRELWPDAAPLPRLRPGVEFAAIVLWDILVANVQVAPLLLGPTARLKPRFVEVPLSVRGAGAITLLASAVSLTPGTVSAELTADRRTLLVHALSEDDPDTLVGTIKTRYERRIQEMFP